MPSLHDPFDLLDTDVKIVPLLSKSKLDDMVTHAMTYPQQPATKTTTVLWHKSAWWSGGLAFAACLLLLVAFRMPMTPSTADEPFDPAGTPMVVSTVDDPNVDTQVANAKDDPENDLGNMVMFATLEGR